ncbi:MAG: tRNA threonylcarbamoyladenosine dehydratase [[Eubacterium] siraeum]|nr:tRNA threonylcarbamoyladenosine dehydratase [[Eubacterium] siraeum]
MEDFNSRTVSLLGEEGAEKLKNSRVAVFGLGGVGSYVTEALVRAGVGALLLVDGDVITPSNLNRQFYALRSTVGRDKTEVARERCLDINPNCQIEAVKAFLTPDNIGDFSLEACDYAVDAIDDVKAKKALIMRCKELDLPIISSMGTGNILDPSKLKIADIYQTSVCPLARVMRHDLRQLGVEKLTVLYSEELRTVNCRPPASVSFVPSAAGLMIAGRVIVGLVNGVLS